MKNWKYKVQSSPRDVIKKLESALVAGSGFIFSVDHNSTSFEIRKPVNYPDQILHRNRIIVNGNVTNSSAENVTDVEFTFTQDFYMKMTLFSMVIFGCVLIALLSRTDHGITAFLLGGMILGIGLILWVALQRKLERDAEKYKTLISEILGSS